MAALNGRQEVCVKLAELGADLNLEDLVTDSCSNCISVRYCIIIMLTFFELGW